MNSLVIEALMLMKDVTCFLAPHTRQEIRRRNIFLYSPCKDFPLDVALRINSRFKYYKASFIRYLLSVSAAPILTQPMGQLWVPIYRKGNKAPKGESSPELEISGAKIQDHLTIVPSGLNH